MKYTHNARYQFLSYKTCVSLRCFFYTPKSCFINSSIINIVQKRPYLLNPVRPHLIRISEHSEFEFSLFLLHSDFIYITREHIRLGNRKRQSVFVMKLHDMKKM